MFKRAISSIIIVCMTSLLMAVGQDVSLVEIPETNDVEVSSEAQVLRRDIEEQELSENVKESVSDDGVNAEPMVLGANIDKADENIEIESADTVQIIMVGDILLHDRVEASARNEDGSYDYLPIFGPMKEQIAQADLAIVNQEVIIGGKELGISGYPAFNAPEELAEDLEEIGFDIACHATNHALDKGAKGLCNALQTWESYKGVEPIGIHDTKEDQEEICVKTVNGIRIAILNYTYGTNGIAMPKDMPFGVDLLEEEKVISDIERAKAQADFVICCPHWGTEYRLEPDAMQQKWTKLFLEQGVDLVIGTHPHVIEPYELITDENGNQMLVYYSLGNFVNWTSGTGAGTANRMVGGMADVTIGRNEQGEVTLIDYSVEALVCHLEEGLDGVKTYPLSEYSEELALENKIRKQDSEFSYAYIVNLCNSIWDNGWK